MAALGVALPGWNLADGSLDSSFSVETDGEVSQLALSEDGMIYIPGNFTIVNGWARRRLARLQPNGVLDEKYDPGVGFALKPGIALQLDGKLFASVQPFLENAAYVDRVVTGPLVRLEGDRLPGVVRLVSERTNGKEGETTLLTVERVGGLIHKPR
jgi:hypothetical protein